jgi:hypothetical protein
MLIYACAIPDAGLPIPFYRLAIPGQMMFAATAFATGSMPILSSKAVLVYERSLSNFPGLSFRNVVQDCRTHILGDHDLLTFSKA